MLIKRKHIPLGPDVAFIPLGNGFEAIIDAKNYDWVSRYKWHVRHARGCHYAIRVVRSGGREFMVQMHRMLMHTPQALLVHHDDRNGLNNLEENMENIARDQHTEIHRFT